MKGETQLPEEALCLAINVRMAMRVLTRIFEHAFRDIGLSQSQFSLLVSIQFTEPATAKALSKLMHMEKSTLTRNLRILERDGMIYSEPCEEDRRERLLRLTAKGRKTYLEAAIIWRQTHDDLVDTIGSDRYRRMLSDLHATINAAEGE